MASKAQIRNQRYYQKIRAKGLCVNCKTHLAAVGKSQCISCATQRSNYERKYTVKLRQEILEAYGGRCACCGETPPEFLALDHINGRGKKDTPLLKARGLQLYLMLKRLGFPKEEFRLLCHNCNNALGFYGYCPHGNLGTEKTNI